MRSGPENRARSLTVAALTSPSLLAALRRNRSRYAPFDQPVRPSRSGATPPPGRIPPGPAPPPVHAPPGRSRRADRPRPPPRPDGGPAPVPALGADAGRDDGRVRGQGFEDLQARAAADAQRHHHQAALAQVRPHVRHVGVQARRRGRAAACRRSAASGGFRPTRQSRAVGTAATHGREARWPAARARHRGWGASRGCRGRAGGLARRRRRLRPEVGGIDAVLHHVHPPRPEVAPAAVPASRPLTATARSTSPITCRSKRWYFRHCRAMYQRRNGWVSCSKYRCQMSDSTLCATTNRRPFGKPRAAWT